MRTVRTELPIESALPELLAALASYTRVVLQAPPGAGKSTVVPLVLLDAPWMRGKRLLMLEPRRLATRAVASRMAQTLAEPVGRTVGYRMRLETKVSAATRIEVVTEGVLTRMLQSDPALEGVGAVLFDEFHERNLSADIGLALTLDAQTNLAPDLRLLVMSATVDGARVSDVLDQAPIVSAEGRAFPVEITYLGSGPPRLAGDRDSPERAVLSAIRRALTETDGDLLVFLPGAGEIRRLQSMLEASATGTSAARERVHIVPLYGELAALQQDAALAPAAPGERKIILATNIAETSLTIEGVRVVIDSGLARRAIFDPVSGMSRLETQRISRASADQRCGRAGRTEPGRCYRLWGESAHRGLAAFTEAEIVSADLAPLAMDLAAWGTSEQALRWLDAPPPPMLASARDLLRSLGALDAAGRLTNHGRAMAPIGAHPRLAHMLVTAQSTEQLEHAIWLAALLSERDLLRSTAHGVRDSDIRSRIEALQGAGIEGMRSDRGAIERVRRLAKTLARLFGKSTDSSWHVPPRSLSDHAGELLVLAYPDRIGQRRDGSASRYQLSGGRGAAFRTTESIGREEFIVALELDDRQREADIRLAAPIDRATLLRQSAGVLEAVDEVQWDAREQSVVARRTIRRGALTIDARPLVDVPADRLVQAMLVGIQQLGIDRLPWNAESRALQSRMVFIRALEGAACADWPDVSDAALAGSLEWLTPWLAGVTRRSHLERLPLTDALRAQLSYAQQRKLDELAPESIVLPTGSRVRIDYQDDNAPAAAMRIQEVFGLAETPRIGGGTVPVTFKLLSPAQRPLQVTRDLASFWRNAYIEVRKDMRGRYPRHFWPEDPLQAEPTRRVKPRT